MQLRERGNDLVFDDDEYQDWIATTETAQLPALIEAATRQCPAQPPVISILLPTYDTDANMLRAALDSVLAQNYPHWQLCIVDDASSEPRVAPLLREYAQRDPRIALHFQRDNRGIAATSNRALELATGAYVALLDHDDVLAPHALLLVVARIGRNSEAQLLYSDSDSLDADGRRIEPFFKPGWNYDLLLGQNYINHLTVYRRQRLLDIGGWRSGFEGSQDYDLLLRAIENMPAAHIEHIPHILYHWRQVPDSVSRTNLGAAVRAARNAIREHLLRTGQSAEVKPCAGAVLYNRIVWQPTTERVAIAVYGDDDAAIARTLQQLRQYAPQLEACAVPLAEQEFQPLNDWAAHQDAPLLGFIAGGLTLEPVDALANLRGQLSRSDIAAVSAKLIDSRGRPRGPLQARTRHDGAIVVTAAFDTAQQADNTGYVSSLLLDRRVFALQAGCLFAKADRFRTVGGWARPLANGLLAGIDLSLRLRARGESLVWSTQALARSDAVALDATLDFATPDLRALYPEYAAERWRDDNAGFDLRAITAKATHP